MSIGNVLKIRRPLGFFLSAYDAVCHVFFSAITILNTYNTRYVMYEIRVNKMIGSYLLMMDFETV